jgi:hypothetical protein
MIFGLISEFDEKSDDRDTLFSKQIIKLFLHCLPVGLATIIFIPT